MEMLKKKEPFSKDAFLLSADNKALYKQVPKFILL